MKYIQEKLNINILNYKEIYYNKRINFDFFLTDFNPENLHDSYRLISFNDIEREREKDKNELYKMIENEFKTNKIDNNVITTFITNYYNDYYNNIKNKEYSLYEISKDIDFTCPFFNALSKTENFNKIFNILISEKMLKDKNNNLKNVYESQFEYLNKNNINYPSITFYVEKNKDVNKFKEFNINFKQIKKLKFAKEKDYSNYDRFDYMDVINSFNVLDNLVYFEFNLSTYGRKDPAKSEIINSFKSLKYLILSDCFFSTKFELKLSNLKHLELNNCINIFINKCNLSEITYLGLKNNKIELPEEKANSLLECPRLNKLILIDDNNYYLDFYSFKNLKYFKGNLNNFSLLKETQLLEEIIIKNGIKVSDLTKIIEKEMGIKGKNSVNFFSVKKIELNIRVERGEFDVNIDDFLRIFPNLLELIIDEYNKSFWTCGYVPVIGEKYLLLTENPNSKLKSIKIVLIGDYGRTIKINCLPYDKMESFDLYVDVINIDSIPLFKSECNIIFNSLNIFRFTLDYPSKPSKPASKAIINLYNNIEKMPNLTEFYLCYLNAEKRGKIIINEELFKKFVEKVARLKSIKKIYFKIREGSWGWGADNIYSKDELKKLFPKIDFNKFHTIKIFKFLSD